MTPRPFPSVLLALAAALVTGCGTAAAVQEDVLSDQGGFVDPEQRLAGDDEGDYCAMEMLRYHHDEAAEILRLADARLMLDCCGQRAVMTAHVDSLIELTERDAPDPSAGRCNTACAYDFAVTIPSVPPGPVVVRLLRDITDAQGGPALVWQGDLDLTHPERPILLDPTPAPGCRAP